MIARNCADGKHGARPPTGDPGRRPSTVSSGIRDAARPGACQVRRAGRDPTRRPRREREHMDVNFSAIFLPEVAGTFLLALLGCGVVANETLPGTKGHGSGFLMVNFGWGLAVFAGVFAAVSTGGHINPAVTLGMLANGATEFADGIPATAANAVVYILAQILGAFLGGIGLLPGVQEALRRRISGGGQTRGLLHRAGAALLRLELRHRGDRHVRAGVRGGGLRLRRTGRR